MTLKEVMSFLEEKGSEQSKKVLKRHGAREPFFGVKVSDLKIIQRKIKTDHQLALKLYATGNSDAMYLAPMVADTKQYTHAQLCEWVEMAYWYYLSDFAVAGAAAESNYGIELAKEWMQSDKEFVASSGWATYASVLSIKANEEVDLVEIKNLLQHIPKNLNKAKNRVRYAMNQFVIACGSYIPELTEYCKEIGEKIGKVEVDMGGTACKVPLIKEYIEKVEKRGSIGKKRKRAMC